MVDFDLISFLIPARLYPEPHEKKGRMRTVFIIWMASVLAASSQTVTTNLVKAAPTFREVGGKVYNVEKSLLWKKIHVSIESTDGKTYVAELMKATGHRVFFDTRDPVDVFDGWVYDHEICITNCPQTAISTQADIWATKVGLSAGGRELWDCGIQHWVSVVTTNNAPLPVQKH